MNDGVQPTPDEARIQRKRRRDALVADALRATGQKDGGWNRVGLANYLSKRHKVSPSTILVVLDEAPELISIGFTIQPRPSPRRQRVTQNSTPRERDWKTVADEVVYLLSDLQTDTVHVEVGGGRPGNALLRMRADFVVERSRSGLGAEYPALGTSIWIACLVGGYRLHEELMPTNPQTLGRLWSLPLVAPESPPVLPEVLVWKVGTPVAAADVVTTCLRDRLGLSVDRVKTRRETCTPRELDLRITGEAMVRRLRFNAGRKNPVETSCDKCGQPLSDPESVRLGIGPECRKYYDHDVLAAVRHPNAPIPRRGAQGPTAWLADVRSQWTQE